MSMVARAFRRSALPLAAYYAITLAVPLANGVERSHAFFAHALVVLVVPVIAILVACAIYVPVGRVRLKPDTTKNEKSG